MLASPEALWKGKRKNRKYELEGMKQSEPMANFMGHSFPEIEVSR